LNVHIGKLAKELGAVGANLFWITVFPNKQKTSWISENRGASLEALFAKISFDPVLEIEAAINSSNLVSNTGAMIDDTNDVLEKLVAISQPKIDIARKQITAILHDKLVTGGVIGSTAKVPWKTLDTLLVRQGKILNGMPSLSVPFEKHQAFNLADARAVVLARYDIEVVKGKSPLRLTNID